MVQKTSNSTVRQPTRKEKQDDSIMNTNNSCIVSKRCVEKLYHGEDHGFLRYFVKKFQRRSPLINRGYWLRMRAIETVVRTFLQQNPSKPKVVVNLGCGYDPLPFQFLSKKPLCEDVKFVDVDYPQLMRQKVKIIRDTPALSKVLCNTDVTTTDITPVILRSDSYLAVACDLEDFATLDRILRSNNARPCDYLFVAEVSITYMDEQAAEAVLQGVAKFESSQFCLLEQFLPDGPEHPFARTMLGHFRKLNSHLRSVTRFPSLEEQKSRFLRNGWAQVSAESLWWLWNDSKFINSDERHRLDNLEPFDEWEEFALFASHYFVLNASTSGQETVLDSLISKSSGRLDLEPSHGLCLQLKTHILEGLIMRRGAASAKANADQILLYGGQGAQGRLSSADFIFRSGSSSAVPKMPGLAVEYHTVTCLVENNLLVVGGRSSPGTASNKCFLIDAEGNRLAAPLPKPLYRHCTAKVGSNKVIIYGGKHNATDVSSSWYLWTSEMGWTEIVEILGDGPPALFGACMVKTQETSSLDTKGILMGGLDDEGRIISKAWTWTFDHQTNRVTCSQVDSARLSNLASSDAFRFGASLTRTGERDLLLSGGIGALGTVSEKHELLSFDIDLENITEVKADWQGERPMLIGCNVESTDGKQILIAGGGATCFSFGTNWNSEGRLLSPTDLQSVDWQLSQATASKESSDLRRFVTDSKSSTARKLQSHSQGQTDTKKQTTASKRPVMKSVDHIKLDQPQDFERVVGTSRPVILDGLDIGPCTATWTIDYLKSQSPSDLKVTVHDSPTPTMSFLSKNFAYKSMPFTAFLDAISSPTAPAHMYLRSISQTAPTTTPTLLATDFPFLAQDFHLPPQLALVSRTTHSSPLRIAGNVAMWLHYDVMANIYCQIRGHRRMLLYPPAAVAHLDFPHGASSARKNPFAQRPSDAPPPHIECLEARLAPGDVLFIPPFWAHAAEPVDGVSVAVNVFFKSLGSDGVAEQQVYAAGKDTYANRDLAAYENGRKAVQRAAAAFKDLPRDARVFYLERLARELKEAARKSEP